jgi:hypothetical protein
VEVEYKNDSLSLVAPEEFWNVPGGIEDPGGLVAPNGNREKKSLYNLT